VFDSEKDMWSIRNQGILVIPIENYPLHNLVYTEPIVTTQGNYSHGLKAVSTSSKLRKSIIAEPNVEVHVHSTTKIPSHSIITTKLVPLDLRNNPSKPIRGTEVTFVQHTLS
jgi:hypothetical protein